MDNYKSVRAERARDKYHRARNDWIASKGGCCALCGSETDLEIDHIDRATKTIHASLVFSRRAEVREAELAKCQVLCKVCHRAKTNSENTLDTPCGSYVKYRSKGCRCVDCTEANRVYQSNRNKKIAQLAQLG